MAFRNSSFSKATCYMSNAVAQPYPPVALPMRAGMLQHPPRKQSSQSKQLSPITASQVLHLTGTGLIFLSERWKPEAGCSYEPHARYKSLKAGRVGRAGWTLSSSASSIPPTQKEQPLMLPAKRDLHVSLEQAGFRSFQPQIGFKGTQLPSR